MSEKRVFKKDYLGELKVLAEGAGRTDLVEFCDKEIEKSLKKKIKKSKKVLKKKNVYPTINVTGGGNHVTQAFTVC